MCQSLLGLTGSQPKLLAYRDIGSKNIQRQCFQNAYLGARILKCGPIGTAYSLIWLVVGMMKAEKSDVCVSINNEA